MTRSFQPDAAGLSSALAVRPPSCRQLPVMPVTRGNPWVYPRRRAPGSSRSLDHDGEKEFRIGTSDGRPPAQPADVSSSPRRALAGIREYTAQTLKDGRGQLGRDGGYLFGDRRARRCDIANAIRLRRGMARSLRWSPGRPASYPAGAGRLLPVIPGADPGGRERAEQQLEAGQPVPGHDGGTLSRKTARRCSTRPACLSSPKASRPSPRHARPSTRASASYRADARG